MRTYKITTWNSILHVLMLCVVVFAVSMLFVYDSSFIGLIIIALGVICLLSLKLFGVQVKSVQPDIVFGIIDNGILAALAIFGSQIAGVAGALIGGVVGNAVTDGIAGLFEGYWAEKNAASHRTTLGSAVGKMAGCLMGAGVILALGALLIR